MKKKAQATHTLVLMLGSIIGLLVIIGVLAQFGIIFKSTTDKSSCQMQFIAASSFKRGGLQFLDPDCDPHKLTITQENLTDPGKINKVKNDIADYGKTQSTPIAIEYKNYFESRPEEWILDEYVAKELKYCWDITGQGKLDLFDDWWTMLDCGEEKNKHPCTYNDIKNIYTDRKILSAISGVGGTLVGGLGGGIVSAGSVPIIYEALFGNVDVAKHPPTFCVLCSRIKFDNVEVKPSSDSMYLWLANNAVSGTGTASKIPYAAYIQNDNFKGIFTKSAYQYSTDKAYAVLYARVNVFGAKEWINKITSIAFESDEVPEDVQLLKLVPYESIKNECTYLVG